MVALNARSLKVPPVPTNTMNMYMQMVEITVERFSKLFEKHNYEQNKLNFIRQKWKERMIELEKRRKSMNDQECEPVEYDSDKYDDNDSSVESDESQLLENDVDSEDIPKTDELDQKPLKSDDDLTDEEDLRIEDDGKDIIVCKTLKLKRDSYTFHFVLKDAVVKIAGREYAFEKLEGYADWR
ncbi:hypothetical protein ACOME3_009914 [Neoechinorhynchus agilis]